ncbi:MAG: nitroreductase [Firmicutes bacterium]|nr:nitroreductase [Bacillota bacterium]
MNEIINNILTRRSIRVFKEEQIPESDLNVILEAATFAPTGMNAQSWHFTAIHSKEKLAQFNSLVQKVLVKHPGEDPSMPYIDFLKKVAEAPNFNFFYHAPTLVIASNSISSASAAPQSDCTAALQNIFLAAHSLGIGSCWIHLLVLISDLPEIRDYLTELGVPPEHRIYGSAALGFPGRSTPKPAPRKAGTITIVK